MTMTATRSNNDHINANLNMDNVRSSDKTVFSTNSSVENEMGSTTEAKSDLPEQAKQCGHDMSRNLQSLKALMVCLLNFL